MLAVVRKGGGIGLATEIRSEKFPQNRFGMASVILRKKVLIPRHSEVYGRVNSKARNGRNWHEKNPAPVNRIDSMFLSETCFGTEFREFAPIFSHGTESRAFSSCGTVRNGIPRVLCSTEWFRTGFRKFSVPRNSRNSSGTNQLFRLFRLPRKKFFVGNCKP
jgi:hypothetical protein